MKTSMVKEAPVRPKEVVRAIAESRAQSAIDSHFESAAAVVLTAEKLSSVWADLTLSFGEWKSFAGEAAILSGEFVVVDLRLEFESGAVTCRTSWGSDGRLAGLFILPVLE